MVVTEPVATAVGAGPSWTSSSSDRQVRRRHASGLSVVSTGDVRIPLSALECRYRSRPRRRPSPNMPRCLLTNALRSRFNRQRFPRMRRQRRTLHTGRRLCRRHAASLLAMASLILNDVDAASEIVVDTIVHASRRTHTFDADDGQVRAALAASVYWRCVGALVLYERFGPSPVPRTVDDPATVPLAGLGMRHRSAMALTLFGGHDLQSVARLLNLSPVCLLRQLEELLTTYGRRSDEVAAGHAPRPPSAHGGDRLRAPSAGSTRRPAQPPS